MKICVFEDFSNIDSEIALSVSFQWIYQGKGFNYTHYLTNNSIAWKGVILDNNEFSLYISVVHFNLGMLLNNNFLKTQISHDIYSLQNVYIIHSVEFFIWFDKQLHFIHINKTLLRNT